MSTEPLQLQAIAKLPAAVAYLEEQLADLADAYGSSSSIAMKQQWLLRLASVEVLLGRYAAAAEHLTQWVDCRRHSKRSEAADGVACSQDGMIHAWISKLEAILDIVCVATLILPRKTGFKPCFAAVARSPPVKQTV